MVRTNGAPAAARHCRPIRGRRAGVANQDGPPLGPLPIAPDGALVAKPTSRAPDYWGVGFSRCRNSADVSYPCPCIGARNRRVTRYARPIAPPTHRTAINAPDLRSVFVLNAVYLLVDLMGRISELAWWHEEYYGNSLYL